MEYHPKKREEILAKREMHKAGKQYQKRSGPAIKNGSPLMQRLQKLHAIGEKIR